MKKNEDELLNWQQACKILGCSKSYFYNLVNAGLLKAIRLGERKGVTVRKFERGERYGKGIFN